MRFFLLPAVLLAGSASAFFRLPCDNPLVIERADPIVAPNAVAGHTHYVVGGSNFSPGSNFDSLRKSECSSCKVKEDMSAYWSPLLYFQFKNGSFMPVPTVGGQLVYYLQRFDPADKTKITAFPKGFQMLTGNPTLRTYDASSQTAQAIGFNCLGGGGRNPWLPKVNCPAGLRAEIRFPSCWDGKNPFKKDGSHVSYSDRGEFGVCPPTHPTRLPTIFYEVMYDVDSLKDLWSQAKNPNMPWVLAMGDATGYGYHGDFQNGWQIDVLQKAMDTCTNDSGNVEDCHVLTLYDRSKEGTCQKTPDIDEVVLGNLASLPGCNPVTTKAATSVSTCTKPTPKMWTSSVYTGAVPPPGAHVVTGTPVVVKSYRGWKYVDCYSDAAPQRALTKQLTITKKSVNACLDAAKTAGYTVAGLEYGGEC